MKTILILTALAGFIPLKASADPEQSYQAGKKLMESATGNKNTVDDRDAEQKLRDYVRERGAQAGGRAADKPVAKPGENQSSRPADHPVARPVESQGIKPATQAAAKPATQAAGQPAAKTAAQPAAKTAAQPAAKTVSKPAETTK